MSLKHQIDSSLADYLNGLNLWDTWVGDSRFYQEQAGEGGKSTWPPKAKPTGAQADANVYPRIIIDSELVSEVEPHTGVYNMKITIVVETKYLDGFAFIPDGTALASCTDRAPAGGTASTIENGHIAHSRLTGEIPTHYFANQTAWSSGIENQYRGIKMLRMRWRGEDQPDLLEGIMATEIEFDAVAYWDGSNAVATDVPEGDMSSLAMTVSVDES